MNFLNQVPTEPYHYSKGDIFPLSYCESWKDYLKNLLYFYFVFVIISLGVYVIKQMYESRALCMGALGCGSKRRLSTMKSSSIESDNDVYVDIVVVDEERGAKTADTPIYNALKSPMRVIRVRHTRHNRHQQRTIFVHVRTEGSRKIKYKNYEKYL